MFVTLRRQTRGNSQNYREQQGSPAVSATGAFVGRKGRRDPARGRDSGGRWLRQKAMAGRTKISHHGGGPETEPSATTGVNELT
jgi:hypothetical protein